MVSIFKHTDFKRFLQEELERRKSRNSKYSLRAFARDLGVSFSRLSEIISNDGVPSPTTSKKISSALKMSSLEKDFFESLILSKHGKNASVRKKALGKIAFYNKNCLTKFMKDRETNLLSLWYYLPVVELLTIKNGPNLIQIANSLQISVSDVENAVQYLAEAGHIVKNAEGNWVKAQSFLQIESPVPSVNIKKFHKELMKKGLAGLAQPIESRKYLSSVFGVKKENILAARKELELFNQKFIKKYASVDSADSAYSFCLQLFNLETSVEL